MNSRRLPILLVVLVVLLALRWWDPTANEATKDASNDVVQALVRPAQTPGAVSTFSVADAAGQLPAADLFAGTRDAEPSEPGNAFEVRMPPAPTPTPPPPAPAPPPRPSAVVAIETAPVIDATPPLPPLQVIGTWRDERGASVFIAGPSGVLQARAGDTLLAEFRVTQVSAQQVQLKHLPSNRDISLTVPAAGPSSK